VGFDSLRSLNQHGGGVSSPMSEAQASVGSSTNTAIRRSVFFWYSA